MIDIGFIIDARYMIVEKIGSGGMSIVYKAMCNKLNRPVAIKVLREDFIYDEAVIKIFQNEARAIASISHPNIVNVFDFGKVGEYYYIVMEYVEGVTLKEYINRKAPLNDAEIISYATKIASGLHLAHMNKITHGDMKSQNIVINSERELKIMDFGNSKSNNENYVSNAIGSVHYFSPEQAMGNEIDERSDLYSLGIIMYEMATGKVPFEGENPVNIARLQINEELPNIREYNEKIDANLEYIIKKLTMKRREDRYQTSNELLIDLSKLANYNSVENFVNIKEEKKQEEVKVDKTLIKPRKEIQNFIENETIFTNKEVRKKTSFVSFLASIGAITLAIIFGFICITIFSELTEKKPDKMPNLVGMSIEKVQADYSKKIKIVKIDHEYSTSAPENTVIKQIPDAKTILTNKSEVKLVISQGRKTYFLPKLVEMKYKDAINFIKGVPGNFKIVLIQEVQNERFSMDEIVEQSPTYGEMVEEGTEIEVIVNKSNKKIVEEENLNVEETGVNTIEENSSKPAVINISKKEVQKPKSDFVTLKKPSFITADSDKKVTVKVIMDNNSDSKLVYENSLKYNDFPVNVKMQESGTAHVYMYVDGVLKTEDKINVER